MKNFDIEVYKKVFKVSLPAIAGFLGLILFQVIDIYWIEKLSSEAVAGVSAAGFIVWTLYAFMLVTGSGCTSLVSQFYGAGRRRRAWEAIVQSTWLSVILSLVICFLFLPIIESPFEWMGLSPDVARMAVEYFYVILLAFPLIFLDMLGGHVFNAYGDTKISNFIMVGSLVVNIVFDPILMFGWYGFPEMGVTGAAIATVLSHAISFVLRVWMLRRKGYIPPFIRFLRFRTFYYKSIVKIGLPNAVTGCVWSLVYPFLTRLITPFGMISLSAVGIGHRLESFPYYTAMAFGIAMTSLTGQAIGRRESKEIDAILSAGLRASSVLLAPFIVAFLLFGHQVMSLMTDDPLLITAGADYLYIVGLLIIFMGWEMVIGGTFTGLGLTYPTLMITIPFTVGRIPLAWYLAFQLEMGVNGVWWAISLTTFVKGFGLYLLYRYYKHSTNSFLNMKHRS